MKVRLVWWAVGYASALISVAAYHVGDTWAVLRSVTPPGDD